MEGRLSIKQPIETVGYFLTAGLTDIHMSADRVFYQCPHWPKKTIIRL
jgi:hypothetical protein